MCIYNWICLQISSGYSWFKYNQSKSWSNKNLDKTKTNNWNKSIYKSDLSTVRIYPVIIITHYYVLNSKYFPLSCDDTIETYDRYDLNWSPKTSLLLFLDFCVLFPSMKMSIEIVDHIKYFSWNFMPFHGFNKKLLIILWHGMNWGNEIEFQSLSPEKKKTKLQHAMHLYIWRFLQIDYTNLCNHILCNTVSHHLLRFIVLVCLEISSFCTRACIIYFIIISLLQWFQCWQNKNERRRIQR